VYELAQLSCFYFA